MKLLWLIFYSSFYISLHAQGWTDTAMPSSKEPNRAEEAYKVNNLIKNPGAGDVYVDGYKIDKRAVQYYHPGSLEGVSLEKARKINFIYLNSFEIVDSPPLSESCITQLRERFDTGAYNHLRKLSGRSVVEVVLEGCSVRLSLLSWEEINSKDFSK